MNRCRKISLVIAALAVSFGVSAQKDLLISGGNSVSSLVCSNSWVYTTGGNKVQNGTGVLGVGSSADNVDTWTKVEFPVDAAGNTSVNISQVNSGSGASFVALDCYGQVWGWGVNDYGQTGNGNDAVKVVTAPVQVELGTSPLKNTEYDDGYGHLANVEVVYAGNANSFAILGSGQYEGYVVAWGGNLANNNYTSCLGTGSDAQALYPTFCKDLDGKYMTNAIRIFSGDHVTMILKSDGTVWTCGDSAHGKYLGRNAAGGYYTGSEGASNAFGAVYKSAGVMLSNIVEIACGDGAYLALDSDGYIWSWGNDGWNSCGGTGSNGNSVPQKVLAGDTDDEDNDGTYLLAKAVGAGQAFGMAVTITGKPVAWGGGGCAGGYVGNGTAETAKTPVYINYASGKVHDDVILINRGDSWGFYALSDGSMYAWGCNSSGQLGLGSTTNQVYATKINPPSGCAFRDPTPSALITPGTSKVCASSFKGYTLDCGFVLAANLQPNYKITWYKDGTQVSTGDGSNVTYKTASGAEGMGTYKVVIKYVGKNNGCEAYEDAIDEITISAYTQEFTPEGYYCGEEGTVKVTPSSTSAVYSWWSTQAAKTQLGESVGAEEVKIDVSSITANADGTKTVYVQETAMGSGHLIPGTKAARTASSNGITQTFASIGLELAEPTTIVSTSLYLLPAMTGSYKSGSSLASKEEAEAQHIDLTGTVTLTLTIYGTQMNNQKIVPNTSDVIKTITYPIEYTKVCYPDEIVDQSWQSTYQPVWKGGEFTLPDSLVTIPIEMTLDAGTYYFGITGTASGNMNTNNTKLYQLNSSLAGEVDDLNGNVSVYGAAEGTNYTTDKSGPLFNFHLYADQGFCDVVAVKLKQDCPCTAPEDFYITNSDASYFSKYETYGTEDTAVVCANNVNATFASSEWAASTSSAFEYIWYKDGAVAKAATAGYKSADFSVTAAGTYKLLVYDKSMPTAVGCQKSATVVVQENPIPTVTVSGGGEICKGETLATPVTFTATGTPGFLVKYTVSTESKAKSSKIRKGYTSELAQPEDVGTYTYTVTSINDDSNCLNEAVTGSATVTIKPIPTATITANKTEMCEGDDPITLTAESDQAKSEFTWGGKGSGTTNPLSLTAPTQSGDYTVTASLNGCESKSDATTVTINAKPTIKTLTSDVKAVCSGETITLSATTSDSEAGTFTWSGDTDITGSGKSVTLTKTVTVDTDVTITLDYESAEGCSAEPKTITVTFYAMPDAPKPADVSYCEKATAVALTATASSGGTLYWYGTNETGGTASTTAPTPSTAVGTANKTYYYVSQKVNGCESDRAKLTVTVNSSLEPSIQIDDDELCKDEVAKVSLTQTYTKVTWSGTASAMFDAMNVATPKFTAGEVTKATEYAISVDVEDDNGCKGTGSAKLKVYPTPTVVLSDPTAVCSGETTNITATVTSDPSTGGTYEWSANVSSTTETSATYGETTSGTVTYDYTSAKGCKATQVTKEVTIYDIPVAPTVAPLSYCVDATAKALTATATTGGTLQWYGTSATGGTASTTAPTPTTKTDGVTSYYVSQKVNGCESDRAAIEVTVNANLTPAIVLSDGGEVCEGNPVSVSLSQTYKTVEWTGTAAASFNSTSTATPVFAGTATYGSYTVHVKVTDENGCEGESEETITINAVPSATLSTFTEKCISDNTVQTITATITPAGTTGTGTWSTNVTKATETTATVAPSDLGAGTHTITYDFESAKGCKATQVETTAKVNALPTPGVTYANNNLCVSGNNSTSQTPTTTGTDVAGTFKYTISGSGTVDATTGAFDPTANVAGTYTVTLTYDDANGCENTATTDITVNALPEITITAPTEMCYNGAAEDVKVTATPVGGTGVWTGTASSTDASFDPTTKTIGANEISYTYTDGNKCQNSEKTTTTVVKVDAPTVGATQTVLINSGSLTGSDELTATATTATDKLSWMAETGGTEIASGSTYSMGVTTSTAVGSYKFAVKEYRTVNGGNCYSDSTIATLVVSACEALAPSASDIYICVNDATKAQTLTATKVSTLADSYISWLDIDPVGKTGTEADGNVKQSNSNTYTPSVSVVAAGDYSFYAAEWDNVNTCWSAGTKVTIHVVENPVVTISSPADICAKGTETVPVTVNPQTGKLTADAGTIDGFNWLPGDYTGDSEAVEFTYEVESSQYADGTTCKTTVTSNTTAHFMEAPATFTESWLIGDVANIPADLMKGTNSSSGKTMKWYAEQSMATELATTNAYATDKTALQTEVAGKENYTKSYWITQTDDYGCESEPTEVFLQLVNCPWTAPTVANVEACQNETLASLEATEGDMTKAKSGVDEWVWYDANNTKLSCTTSSFAHGVSNATAGVTTYYVSYLATEVSSGQQCESPKTAVTVTVDPLPEIEVSDVEMCYAGGKQIVTATANGTSSTLITTGGEWTLDGGTTGINKTTGEVDPTFKGQVDGEYTMRYTYTDAKNCTNYAEAKVTIEYPEVPTTTDFIGNVSKPLEVSFTAGNIEAKTGTTVNWYETETATTAKSTGNPWKSGDDPEVEVTKSYYVSQTVNGCESEKAEQKVQITQCPWTAPTVVDATVCQDETVIPEMTATQQSGVTVDKWVWKKSGSDLSNDKASYTQTSNSTKGITEYEVSYWATEPISGVSCQSPSTKVTTTVYGLPEITFDKKTEDVCYTAGSVQIEVTGTPGDNGNGTSNGKGSGVWTSENNAVSSTNVFDTKVNGETTGTYDLTYTYTDGKGCVNSATRKITVTYLPKPETEGFYAMTTQTNPITVKVTTALETGAVAQWFTSETATTTVAGEGKSWATGDATDMTWNKKYYARQYSAAGGCFSEATEAVVKVVPCPIPAVTVSDEKACNYDEIPTLTAMTGDWGERDGGESKFYFYASGKTTPESQSSDGTYQPSGLTAGEYTYNVSEYNAVPLAGLTYNEGCEGPKTTAKITIIGTGMPTVAPSTGEVCQGETNPLFTASNIVGTVGWYEEDPGELGIPESAEKGNKTTFTPTGTTVDTYSVWAVMFSDGCYGPKKEVTYTIKAIPEEPTVENAEVCYEESNKSVTATGEGTINWYADAAKTTLLQKGSNGYLSKETMPGSYKYYAAQTLKGCEGNTNAAIFRIKSLPSVPAVTPQANICEYDEAPAIHVSGENITWYASDKATVIGDGDTYQTTDMTAGTKRYFATQTVEGCEGSMSLVSFTINEKPINPTVTGASVCEGNTEIPSLGTNMNSDKWYADENAATFLTTGYSYTPIAAEVGNSDKTYYVQRELNSCVSDLVPVLLHVIPKPEFTISSDTTLCIYDAVIPVEATNFYPEMNEKSTVNWQIKKGNVVKYFDDSEDHTLDGSSVITEEDEYTISGSYKYVYDNIYCTSDTLSMKYTVIGRARTPIVFSSVICQGEEIKDLQALGSPNIVWGSLDGTLPVVAYGPKYQFSAGQTLDTGTYRFVIYDMNIYDAENNLGCKSEIDTVSMTVAPAAMTKLIGADSVCVGATEQYYTQYTKESTYYWNVTGDNLNYSKDAMSSSVRYVDWVKSGVDTLTVYEQTWAGCEGWDTLVVKIAAMPKPMFAWSMPGASNIIEMRDSTIQDSLWFYNEEGEFIGEPVTYEMAWNFGHQGELETEIDTLIPYDKRNYPITEGDYVYGFNCPTLTVTNSFGCKEKVQECIFVNITSSLYVPNAFSPTNPAHSVRTFQPKGYNLKTCEISVYDKWGNLLWFSDAVEDGKFVGSWDGRYDGKMMKSDVYIWKMEATFLDGQIWEGFDMGHGKKAKFGSVTLVR